MYICKILNNTLNPKMMYEEIETQKTSHPYKWAGSKKCNFNLDLHNQSPICSMQVQTRSENYTNHCRRQKPKNHIPYIKRQRKQNMAPKQK